MSERPKPHDHLVDYVLGQLEPEERAAFEQHLLACPGCRRELEAIGPVARMAARAAPAYEPPADLDRKVLAAVVRAAESDAVEAAPAAPKPARTARSARVRFPPRRRAGYALALAAVIAAVIVITRPGGGDLPSGEPELMARLTSPGTAQRAGRVRVDMLGTGRVVQFESDDLPILPKGEYYELWFVGPGDSATNPNRISAGTFHPDEGGSSKFSSHAAVDPVSYPILSVTAEPGDGDPRPSGQEIMRSRP